MNERPVSNITVLATCSVGHRVSVLRHVHIMKCVLASFVLSIIVIILRGR